MDMYSTEALNIGNKVMNNHDSKASPKPGSITISKHNKRVARQQPVASAINENDVLNPTTRNDKVDDRYDKSNQETQSANGNDLGMSLKPDLPLRNHQENNTNNTKWNPCNSNECREKPQDSFRDLKSVEKKSKKNKKKSKKRELSVTTSNTPAVLSGSKILGKSNQTINQCLETKGGVPLKRSKSNELRPNQHHVDVTQSSFPARLEQTKRISAFAVAQQKKKEEQDSLSDMQGNPKQNLENSTSSSNPQEQQPRATLFNNEHDAPYSIINTGSCQERYTLSRDSVLIAEEGLISSKKRCGTTVTLSEDENVLEGFKNSYYRGKFESAVSAPNFLQRLARTYVEGICWVMHYYYRGCPSWAWYYDFHYAPFASDLASL
eukprot:gene9767-1968_t